MVQQLRAPAALPEDPSLIPSTDIAAHNSMSVTPVRGEVPPSSVVLQGDLHACDAQTDRQTKHTHKVHL